MQPGKLSLSVLLALIAIIIIPVDSVYALRAIDSLKFRTFDSEGIVDSNFKELLKAEYRNIEHQGNGIFLASEIPPAGSSIGSDKHKKFLFNKNGKELKFKLPNNAWLYDIHWLGAAASKNPNLDLTDLAKDTILKYVIGWDNIGLCDINGNIIVSASDYNCQSECCDGASLVSKFPRSRRNPSNLVYFFNCKTKSLTQIPDRNLTGFSTGYQFCEGFAPYRENNKPFGYINTAGKMVIKPQFKNAGSFVKGMAWVRSNDPKITPNNFIINKQGKRISPATMETLTFLGDYAIACNAKSNPLKFGVINRSFKYVVQPKYTYLLPQFFNTNLGVDQVRTNPDFYVAGDTNHQVLLAPTGKVIANLPPGFYFQGLDKGNLIRFAVKPGKAKEKPKFVYLNMKGEKFPSINYKMTGKKRVLYEKLTRDRYLKIVNIGNGKSDTTNKNDTPQISWYEPDGKSLLGK